MKIETSPRPWRNFNLLENSVLLPQEFDQCENLLPAGFEILVLVLTHYGRPKRE